MLSSAQHTNQNAQRPQIKTQRDPTYQLRKSPTDCERGRRSPRPLNVDNGGAVPPGADSLAPDDAPAAGESMAHYLERIRGAHRSRRTFAW